MAVQYNKRLRGRTVMVLPASCPLTMVVTRGTADTKSKSSNIPLGWGGGGGSGHE